ncbi:hypothetical protein QUF90_10330 [Desulfococcaceae bacterium HSG9]|nr:hypothetical protein [Desulfococcaceae bacterium HSG9]
MTYKNYMLNMTPCHFGTVARGYNLAASWGIISSKVGRGTIVGQYQNIDKYTMESSEYGQHGTAAFAYAVNNIGISHRGIFKDYR